MLDSLYNTDILTLASDLRNEGLSAPCGTARVVSKLCGSELEIDIDMKDGIVTACALRVQACALGQASAAILKAKIIGANITDVTAARDVLTAMLKSGGEAPKGRFSDLKLLAGVAKYPARYQSTLLAWNGAVEAMGACALFP